MTDLRRIRRTTNWILTGVLVTSAMAALIGKPAKNMTRQFLNLDGQKAARIYTDVITSRPGTMIFVSRRAGAEKDGVIMPSFGQRATNTFEDLKRCLALARAETWLYQLLLLREAVLHTGK